MDKGILKSFLKYHGLVLYCQKGEEYTTQVLLPFFLMDLAYQIYDHEIRPVKLRHELQKIKTDISHKFYLFNTEMNLPFDADQKEEFCDEMDLFEEYIHNDVVILQVAIAECINFLDIKDQRFLSNLYAMNAIFKAAEFIYERSFFVKTPLSETKETGDKNEKIIGLMNACKRLAKVYYRDDRSRDLSDDDRIDNAISALIRKIVNYLKILKIE